jgi:general secretion pathway protein G
MPKFRVCCAVRRERLFSGDRGFTLLELIVVITIIGLLSTLVAVKVAPVGAKARLTKAQAELNTILDTARTLQTLTGNYPESVEAMVDARDRDGRTLPCLDKLPTDPWGNDYVYEVVDDAPRVICYGKDGVPGGEGEATDLVVP